MFLDGLDIDELRKLLDLAPDVKLKKNGTFPRKLYYTVDGKLTSREIPIQKLHLTFPNRTTKYISVFPSFIIKYNKVSADLIERISKIIRKGEDIFSAIQDPQNVLPSEDLLHRSCQRVNVTCEEKSLAAVLNARYTEIYGYPVRLDTYEETSFRYPAIYVLYRTGEIYTGEAKGVLVHLNKLFQFLR